MVKKKGEGDKRDGWLDDMLDNYEKTHPIVKSIWFAVEITPPHRYSYDNGHGGAEYDWTDQKVVKVSPDFDCSGLAHEWIDMHEPDEGKSLEVYRQDLRETTIRRWGFMYPSA